MAVALNAVRVKYHQPELPMFTSKPVALDVPKKPSLRMDEAAVLLGCSEEHVRHLIEEGSLAAIDVRCVGASRPAFRVMQASVVKFINDRKTL